MGESTPRTCSSGDFGLARDADVVVGGRQRARADSDVAAETVLQECLE